MLFVFYCLFLFMWLFGWCFLFLVFCVMCMWRVLLDVILGVLLMFFVSFWLFFAGFVWLVCVLCLFAPRKWICAPHEILFFVEVLRCIFEIYLGLANGVCSVVFLLGVVNCNFFVEMLKFSQQY